MIIEYARLREDVVPPTRGNPSDAGLDVYFNPESGKSISKQAYASGCRMDICYK